MAEDLHIITGTKKSQYEALLPQVQALIKDEPDLTANLANTVAALKEQFNWLWVGFYLVKENELVLGPFQGPVACTRIAKGRGVCGTCWNVRASIVVPNVRRFPGHISCNSRSQAEIVVPVIRNKEVVAILDVDSEHYDHFDETDQHFLELLVEMLVFN